MFLEKSLRYLLLLSVFAIQCSGPKSTTDLPAKPADRNESLAKVKISDLDGKPMSLKDFAGKPIFLNYWATWCGPCVSEMASIEKASRQFKDEIVFLAVSNESPALIKSYLKKNKFSFNFAHLDVNYPDVYVVVLPTTMLIDANGQVVEEEEGYRDWADAESVEKLRALVKK